MLAVQQAVEMTNNQTIVTARKHLGLVCVSCGSGFDKLNTTERNGKEVLLCTECYLVGFYSGK